MTQSLKPELAAVRVLCFDVFGTVVDWRGSIIAEVASLAAAHHLEVDAEAVADAWRRGYPKAMDRVRKGELPWTRIDQLHRLILDDLLGEFGLSELSETDRQHLNLVWHRLHPWADTVAGLLRLKKSYVLATLSNGNVSLLVDLARFGALPFDMILSAELFHAYKPDAEVYLGAARLLDVRPEETMLVAAHKSDLDAAHASGFRTALILRELEYGKGRHPEPGPEQRFDINAADFLDLADQLGA
jgi:2-haloacid dehalogenase